MQFQLTPVNSELFPHFKVVVSYEHGGSDCTVRRQTHLLNLTDLEDLAIYIKEFNRLSAMIEANRSDDVEYPDELLADFADFYFTFDIDGLDVSIEFVPDEIIDDFATFTRMTISEIYYFDEHGGKFKVTWEE